MSGEKQAREVVDGTEVIRFRRYIPPRNVLLFVWWPVWWAWLLWRLIRGRFDLVHAMDIATLVPTAAGKALLGYRLIYDSRDPLGLALDNVRWPVPQFFTMLDRLSTPAADGILLSQGDVRACAEFFGRRAAQKVPVVRVLNVPTLPPPSEYRVPTARPLRINYSGYISPVRGAFILAEVVEGRTDVVVDVVGEIRYPQIRQRFEQMANMKLYGRVPYEKALQLMDQADVVWVYYDPALKNAVISSANKMFESMMLSKPYLTTTGSWYGKVARQFGLGWPLPYGDVEKLRGLIERLNADPSLLVEAGRRGREAFVKHFTWPKQRENVLQLYRCVLQGAAAASMRRHKGWKRFIGE